MAKKKRWVFLGDRPERYLETGEEYEFKPKVSANGEVQLKILGDSRTQKVTLGYPSIEEFNANWKEVSNAGQGVGND